MSESNDSVSDDVRRLRYQLRKANKAIGRQGATIHLLRAEIAEVRQLNSRAERGELRAADRAVQRLETLLASAREEIVVLNEKLKEQDSNGLDTVYEGRLDDVINGE